MSFPYRADPRDALPHARSAEFREMTYRALGIELEHVVQPALGGDRADGESDERAGCQWGPVGDIEGVRLCLVCRGRWDGPRHRLPRAQHAQTRRPYQRHSAWNHGLLPFCSVPLVQVSHFVRVYSC
jgi:hypothetical protein